MAKGGGGKKQTWKAEQMKKESVLAHICDPSTWEMEAGRSRVQGQSPLKKTHQVKVLALQCCKPEDQSLMPRNHSTKLSSDLPTQWG